MKAKALLFEKPVDYSEARDIQSAIHAGRLRGSLTDTVICLQHTPTITLGRRGRDKHLNATRAELECEGIDLHESSRGGDVTCHGPGQWVLYPIIKLSGSDASAHGYLWKLEEVAIRTIADFGVRGYRREGMNGAWTDRGKIAAIGFHIKRWVTLHGMSFNAGAVPAGFKFIVACGLEGEKVSSIADILGANCPAMPEIASSILNNFAEVFRYDLDVEEVKTPSPCLI